MATITITRGPSWTTITGDPQAVDAARALLDRPFSYEVPGAMWAPSYQNKVWDGRKRLIKKLRGGGAAFPSGLSPRATEILRKKFDVQEIDARGPGVPCTGRTDWTGPALRDYQAGAVAAVLANGGGLVRLPIRAGKTVTAGYLISQIRQRALFIVPSDMLLQQTQRSLQACLPGLGVTCLGDGDRDVSGDVVVATIQSVAMRAGTRDFAALQKAFGILIVDEFHHLTGAGESWRDAALAIEAQWRIGLSATVGLDTDSDGADLWLEALTGPIVYSVTISDLIDRGYLVRPTIHFKRYDAPVQKGKWSPAAYGQHVVDCAPRNDRIVSEAIRLAASGHRVLIDVSQVKHGKILARLLRGLVPTKSVAMLIGQTKDADRVSTTQAFRKGDVRILIATIMGEGVDVPEIDVVINAEGGRGEVSTIQRLRNLTLCEGKTNAIVIDFVDDHHRQLREWTIARLRIYKGERAFRIKLDPQLPGRAEAAAAKAAAKAKRAPRDRSP